MFLPEATPCAPSPESYEWLKILLAAAVGMVTGLIADPIRGVIQWRINILRMEIAIQTDFLMLSVALAGLKHGLVPPEKFWLGVNLPAYEYY